MKSTITLLLFLAAQTMARGSKGHGGSVSGGFSSDDDGGMNSNPLELVGSEIAALVFYIFFLVFCLGALVFIIKRPRGQYPRQTPFMALLLTTVISFIISYSLGTYEILAASPEISTDWETVANASLAGTFFLRFGLMSFLAGMCLVLDWRARQPSYAGTLNQPQSIPSIIRIASPVLLFSMFVFTIILLAIEGSGQADVLVQGGGCLDGACYGGGLYVKNWAAVNAVKAMDHLYVASHALLTIVIVMTTLTIWKRRSVKAESELSEFDKRVTARILYAICPAISVAALYLIIDNIVAYVNWPFLDSGALLVTRAVFYVITFGIAINGGIKLGS